MTFSDLNISPVLLNALNDKNLHTPSTIQQKTFPVIMSGCDVVAVAQTGSGKTIAYLLPLLMRWRFTKEKNPSVLIVVPTRELVLQVEEVLKSLTGHINIRIAGVYGGVNMIQQSPAIAAGLDILVATPGRLLDFALNGLLKLRNVKQFVIDEVDEMLNLGFRPQLVRIINLLPARRQNLMVSATLSEEIHLFIDDFFVNPAVIEAARAGTPPDKIKQVGILLPNFFTKINFLKFLLKTDGEFSKILLFVSTKKLADDVFEQLAEDFPGKIGIIHSNKSQNYRVNNYRAFNENKFNVLIATDIAARGLDFDNITHVINFDLPEDAESYVHRIGRTGRVDKKGVAISLVTKADSEMLNSMEKLMEKKIPLMQMPEEVEISDRWLPEELPQQNVKIPPAKHIKTSAGTAFHEKKEKNKKVNQKTSRAEQMRIKYGKAKTRGQKK
jgi:ATP-dependent RNA helicase RhlE